MLYVYCNYNLILKPLNKNIDKKQKENKNNSNDMNVLNWWQWAQFKSYSKENIWSHENILQEQHEQWN